MRNQLLANPNQLLRSLRRRGFGLMTILFALAILGVFTLAVLTTTTQTIQAVGNGERVDRARYAAYSGIQSALERLNRVDPSWARYVKAGTAPPASPTPDDEDLMQVTFSSSSDVQAIVAVYNNSDFCPVAFRSATAPDGTVIPHGKIYISATAFINGQKKLETASLGVLTTAAGVNFDKALFGDSQLAVSDSTIDAFSSDNTTPVSAVSGSIPASGPDTTGWAFQYAPYLTLVGGSLQNTQQTASVGTNSPSSSDVVLSNSSIDGGLQRGTGYVSSGPLPSDVYFSKAESTGTKSMPKIFVPPTATALPAQSYTAGAEWKVNSGSILHVTGDLTVDGGKITVQPDASGTINPVQIFVDGDVNFVNGAQINWGGKPKNLQIYRVSASTGSTTSGTTTSGSSGTSSSAGGGVSGTSSGTSGTSSGTGGMALGTSGTIISATTGGRSTSRGSSGGTSSGSGTSGPGTSGTGTSGVGTAGTSGGTSGGATVTPTGAITVDNAQACSVFASPTDVKIQGSSEIFGAVIASNVAMNGGSKVHYDSALNSISVGSSDFAVGNSFSGTTAIPVFVSTVIANPALLPPVTSTLPGTSGAGTSGVGTSGVGTSGTGTSGVGTSGTGTSGTGTTTGGTGGGCGCGCLISARTV